MLVPGCKVRANVSVSNQKWHQRGKEKGSLAATRDRTPLIRNYNKIRCVSVQLLPQAGLSRDSGADDQTLYFAGALVDFGDLGVAHEPVKRK